MLSLKQGLAVCVSESITLHAHTFGKGSLANLAGVHPDYVTLVSLAIRLNRIDGTVIAGGGLRTREQALTNVANGTGILHSLHRVQADGWGHAVDLIPYVGYPTWDAAKCREMAESVRTAAAILSLPIRQGLDWDQDSIWVERGETDFCHVEKPKLQHEAQAVVLMKSWRESLGLGEDWAEDMLAVPPVENHTEDLGFPPKAGMPIGCSCPSCGQHLKLVAVA